MKKSELLAAGLNDEQIAAVLAMHKAGLEKNTPDAEAIKQLKAEKLAAEKLAAEAEALAQQKEEERLKAAGDLDGLKKHYDQQARELKRQADQEIKTAKDALILRDKALARSKILTDVDPRYKFAAEKMLDDMIAVTHDETGAARYTIKLGDQDHASEADFLTAAKHDKDWQNILKAPESTGSGAGHSSAGQSGDIDSAFDARLRAAGLVC